MTPKACSVFEAQSAEDLAARYDEWASSYEKDLDDHGGPAEAADVLSRYAPLAARILDAGCGTGLAGPILAKRGYTLLEGLDLSAGMLREAAKKGCYTALHHQTMGQPLSFLPNTFDAVLSVGVFVRAHAPSNSFSELIRITRPGGHIVFTLRPEFLVTSDFRGTIGQHLDAGRWRLAEATEPFDGRYRHFPGITLQVWAYEVLANG